MLAEVRGGQQLVDCQHVGLHTVGYGVSIPYSMVMALSREDWTTAALDALAEVGLSAVAIDPLARRLGATKGFFYWHFTSRDELIAATLELWERRDTLDLVAALEAIPDPQERLVALARRPTARPRAAPIPRPACSPRPPTRESARSSSA